MEDLSSSRSTSADRSGPFLVPLSLSAFAVIYSGAVIAPLVTQLAGEFDVSTGSVGLAVAAYSLPAIVVGMIAGPHADRYGRKRFLIVGALWTGIFTLAAALAPTFAALLVLRALAGFGAALVLPNMMAAVADRFPYRERGRAIAKVFVANTLGQAAGITFGGIVAEHLGWRVAVASAGMLLVAVAAAVAPVVFPRVSATLASGTLGVYRAVLGDRSAVAILAANLLGVVAWGTWGTFIVAFFQRGYGVAQGLASTYALVLGVGMLVGTQAGGWLGDRARQKVLLALSLSTFGALVVVVTVADLPAPLAIGLSLLGAVAFGVRATANGALMTAQVPQARTTVLAISQATVGAGAVFGTPAGGALLDAFGFPAVGAYCFATAVASSALVALYVREGEQHVPDRDMAAALVEATPSD